MKALVILAIFLTGCNTMPIYEQQCQSQANLAKSAVEFRLAGGSVKQMYEYGPELYEEPLLGSIAVSAYYSGMSPQEAYARYYANCRLRKSYE